MEELIPQLGVPGILLFLFGKEMLTQWTKRKNGNSKSPFGNPGHLILEKIDQTNKLLEKVVDHDEKQLGLLQALRMEQKNIREDIKRCEDEVRRTTKTTTL